MNNPFLESPELLVKNETVKGIIGNTHGVNNAIKPPRNPKIKIEKLLFSSISCFSYLSQPVTFNFNSSDSFWLRSSMFIVSSSSLEPSKLNLKVSSPKIHLSSLQV